MTPRRTPAGVLEILRLFVVVFGAGAGYEVGRVLEPNRHLLGPFGGAAVGVVLGTGFGYVLGGIVSRSTVGAVDRVETSLRDVSAESLVAGAVGAIVGLVLGAAVSWPLLLIPTRYLAIPLFCFVVAVIGFAGYRLGAGRHDQVVAILGQRTGLTPKPAPASALPKVLDTSVAIDGRILEVVRAGFLHGQFLVATPVLAELQGLADAADDLRRSKGRRGLALLETLKREPGVMVTVLDEEVPGVPEVDAKLVRICLDRPAALLTLDTNLAKAAGLAGVRVLNLHQLTLALRPPVVTGDEVSVLLIKNGKEPGQAVGYLDDGTMVVAERSRQAVGLEARVRVTSILTTANGRLVFAEPVDGPGNAPGTTTGNAPGTATGNAPGTAPASRPARSAVRPVPGPPPR